MAPEDIVNEIDTQNRDMLYGREDLANLTREQVVILMNEAAIRGFRLGGNYAFSRLKTILVTKLMTKGL